MAWKYKCAMFDRCISPDLMELVGFFVFCFFGLTSLYIETSINSSCSDALFTVNLVIIWLLKELTFRRVFINKSLRTYCCFGS